LVVVVVLVVVVAGGLVVVVVLVVVVAGPHHGAPWPQPQPPKRPAWPGQLHPGPLACVVDVVTGPATVVVVRTGAVVPVVLLPTGVVTTVVTVVGVVGILVTGGVADEAFVAPRPLLVLPRLPLMPSPPLLGPGAYGTAPGPPP
jgi:hypothetical protein